MSNKNNVVSFNQIKEKINEKQINEQQNEFDRIWKIYKQEAGESIEDLTIMSKEELLINFQEAECNDCEIVFTTEYEAAAYSRFLLSLPEYDHVLYFNVIPAISRVSTFFRITPVFRDEGDVVFPSTEMKFSLDYYTLQTTVENQFTDNSEDNE